MPRGANTKKINLALQGGGAHGAFTWGALDRLLDDERIEIDSITATSAGAMNAAALKAVWVAGGRGGAKESLKKFWLGVAGLDPSHAEVVGDWLRMIAPSPTILSKLLEASPVVLGTEALTRALSPYQFNPSGYHPLRSVVDEMMALGDVCQDEAQKLFIAATNVRSGKVRVFAGQDVTTDAILASACLPTLYQAIEIDDPLTGKREAYWDGGYMGNPSLYPLFYRSECRDILIIHINPIEREELPFTSPELFWIAFALLFAGCVKGATGLGYSTTSLPLLALVIGLKPALPLVLAPSFASNLVVLAGVRPLGPAFRRFAPLLVAAPLGVAGGLTLLGRIEGASAGAALGLALERRVGALHLDVPFSPSVSATAAVAARRVGSGAQPTRGRTAGHGLFPSAAPRRPAQAAPATLQFAPGCGRQRRRGRDCQQPAASAAARFSSRIHSP